MPYVPKKTYKGWEKSGLNLREYIPHPTEIDISLWSHLAEVVSPHYCGHGVTQCGEPEIRKGSELMYETVSSIDGRYFYLGVLPSFKEDHSHYFDDDPF